MADSAPSGAKDAVLVQSEEMPADAQKVEELDFNKLKGPITAHDLFMGMRHMGFQASAMSEAIRIINEMVGRILQYIFFLSVLTKAASMERPRDGRQNHHLSRLHI